MLWLQETPCQCRWKQYLRRAPISGNQEWRDGMGEEGTGKKEGSIKEF